MASRAADADFEGRLLRLGATPDDIARRLGITPRAVYYWINGRRRTSEGGRAMLDLALRALEYEAGILHCPCCPRHRNTRSDALRLARGGLA